jgi:hypothetical protein
MTYNLGQRDYISTVTLQSKMIHQSITLIWMAYAEINVQESRIKYWSYCLLYIKKKILSNAMKHSSLGIFLPKPKP